MESNTRNTCRFDVWADYQMGTNPLRILELSIAAIDLLAELHEDDKSHGNISPRTLLIQEDGSLCRTSFQKARQEEMSAETVYAPLEAYSDDNTRRPATRAGDIYALSAVIYRAIYGQTPLRAILRLAPGGKEKLEFPKDYGDELRNLLLKGLSLKEENRLQSAKDLRLLVEKAAQSKEIKSRVLPPPILPEVSKRLPRNLTVGKDFEVTVAELIKNKGKWSVKFNNLEELGFAHNEASDIISGKPSTAGEKQITLELTLSSGKWRKDYVKPVTIEVTVNPDPDSLWKDLPVNLDALYQKSNFAKQELKTKDARILVASQRGRSHAHEGLFREDDFRIGYDEKTGWHLLAVSDGAGSSKFSRRGSEIACEQALAFMASWLPENAETLDEPIQLLVEKSEKNALQNKVYQWLAGASVEARKAIQKQADQHEPPAALRDFHATLLLSAVKKLKSGWVIVSFSVGDGGIAFCGIDGKPVPMCTPDSGEFSGQTVFLTVQNVLKDFSEIMKRIHVEYVSELDALVLMTDGITDPLFPTESCLSDSEVWKSFWFKMNEETKVEQVDGDCSERLLKWLSFKSPGNHDDRTLAILMPINRKGLT